MTLSLATVCAPWPDLRLEGRSEVAIGDVVEDSRLAGPGSLFVAARGAAADGHHFVGAAVAAGCAAVAVEAARRPELALDVATARPAAVVVADNTCGLAARLAREFHGRPDAELRTVGVTGTNGKTTVAFLVRQMLSETLGPCGLLGTVHYITGDRPQPAPLTTPGGPELYRLLSEMVANGCCAVAMEISSHALDQQRVRDLELDVAVLTNLGRDHLDYHADRAAYLHAKARILDLLRSERPHGRGIAVINAAEKAWNDLDTDGLQVVRFATSAPAADDRPLDLSVRDSRLSREGIELTLQHAGGRLQVRSPLVGRFNVENLLAAFAVAQALGLPLDRCAQALSQAGQVPGRMECLALPNGATATVDYAHTPDALAAVLSAGRELTTGRLLLVFGCGGDRDAGKRPLMGAVAARQADRVWITSDNPRNEDPAAICHAIERGFLSVAAPLAAGYDLIADRTAAIRAALAAAAAADLVVVAGKGHEDYQLIGGRRLHLDDRQIVRDWITEAAHA